ncbi:phosphate ABC transporter ATP-binding protein [Desulfofustis limnaeus]|jgi:phosphate transport system ATP-binding protein|uniref:Phosphate import ATP-binding protein PstB n=1 Tax=Desulfofustis limnaeus TaxID=2740163 RepID=A0ABN6MAN5_9BACT|nr:ATP-binding cassette domain-containing protein [Desulfofustis limnaeus]MDX9895853.1 ATP-binding cassette domain-containing protein [Desulfofustis sp.]BDD88424.1 phosphate import ATP-binding protein PstB [Desulfofustis limnaeus]
MDSSAKIITRSLTFSYGKRLLFGPIDLALPENNIIAVTGPSGAGKSTFLSIFNRLWEENGTGHVSGTVLLRLAGTVADIYRNDLDLSALRRKVGMVFQTPNPLPMSIRKNVAFPLFLAGRREGERDHLVERALQRAHLFDEVKDRLHEDARNLSGGQQQRLCIARALMLEPEILLLDEPTSSLDGTSSAGIEALLVELRQTCTLLMVSHYQDQVRRIADQVFEMIDQNLVRIA